MASELESGPAAGTPRPESAHGPAGDGAAGRARPPARRLPTVRDAVYPLALPAAPRLFDPINGLVHYFVRPNDEFALNSLELLTADACLTRLLMGEGFERVTFLEPERGGLAVSAYGAAPGDPREAEDLKRNFPQALYRALKKSGACKTALVMPLTALERSGGCRDGVADVINKIEKTGNGGNILLLTAAHMSNLVNCFAQPAGFHPWLAGFLSETGGDERADAAARELAGRGMLVRADEYHADEIANLLLRKKLVEGAGVLRDLPVSKVYGLAGPLLEHALQIRRHFTQIPYQNRGASCIRQLNRLLDGERVQRELVEAAARVEPSGVGYSDRLTPLLLERIYGIDTRRCRRLGDRRQVNLLRPDCRF